MKIAVSGAHSTGKSTYLSYMYQYLIDRGVSVKLLGNDANVCPLPIKEQQTFSSTMWLIANCIKNEIEIYDKCDILLVDRPVLDAWGYYKASNNYTYDPNEEYICLGIIKRWMNTYDFILTSNIDCNYQFSLVEDEITYRNKVEQYILYTYNQLKINTYAMETKLLESQFKSICGL